MHSILAVSFAFLHWVWITIHDHYVNGIFDILLSGIITNIFFSILLFFYLKLENKKTIQYHYQWLHHACELAIKDIDNDINTFILSLRASSDEIHKTYQRGFGGIFNDKEISQISFDLEWNMTCLMRRSIWQNGDGSFVVIDEEKFNYHKGEIVNLSRELQSLIKFERPDVELIYA